MKGLSAILLIALLAVATFGLSGEGPVWTKYVGAGTVFVLLMLILQGVSNIPNAAEQRKIIVGSEIKQPPVIPDDDDDESSTRARRTARN
jgi:hypothetical protein